MVKTLKCDPTGALPPPDMANLVARLHAGGLVAIATETVYGLAADASNGHAVAVIFALKQRPQFNPLICHVDGIAMAKKIAKMGDMELALAKAFWPGPLTLVMPIADNTAVHPLVTAGLETIAVRQPSGVAGAIISQFGRPLAAPSANRSGKLSPTSAHHVVETFGDNDLVIVDAGPCAVGLESTIVRVDPEGFRTLRPGAITTNQIAGITGLCEIERDDDTIIAPGMLASHYAPHAQLRIGVTHAPAGAMLLGFGAGDSTVRQMASRFMNLSESGDLAEAAANLFEFLAIFDNANADLIFVEPIPMTGLGIAINDRLARAAAPRTAGKPQTR